MNQRERRRSEKLTSPTSSVSNTTTPWQSNLKENKSQSLKEIQQEELFKRQSITSVIPGSLR